LESGGEETAELACEGAGRDRLGEEDGGAIRSGVNEIAADEDGGQMGAQGADAGDEPGSLEAGHDGIGDHSVDAVDLATGRFEAEDAVFAGNNVVASGLENAGEENADGAVVLDDEDGGGVRGGGPICAIAGNHGSPRARKLGTRKKASQAERFRGSAPATLANEDYRNIAVTMVEFIERGMKKFPSGTRGW
jgi:hypothetical protein